MLSESEIHTEYVSVCEASEILGVNESRIRQIMREGRFIGAFKFADTWMIPRNSVEGYVRKKPGAKPKNHVPNE